MQIRLDQRLVGRVDPSDVLQEAFLDVMARAGDYKGDGAVPVYLWFRFLALQRLLAIHRRHLGAKMRDARREIALGDIDTPEVSTRLLAGELLPSLTSPSSGLARQEREAQLTAALEKLPPADRDVLALRHFEELSNDQVAQVLSIKKSAASAKYVRALERLRQILLEVPGFFD